MREYNEFLTEREIFILKHHPAMTYKAIGIELGGISAARVRQLKAHSERLIRQEKSREQAEEREQTPVTFTLRRKDLWVIIRGLKTLQTNLLRPYADMRRKEENLEEDPDYQIAENLIQKLRDILKSNL